MKAYNFRKSQEWEMSTDRKADRKTNRSFKRSERFQARRSIKKQVENPSPTDREMDTEKEMRLHREYLDYMGGKL
jgi:hypothetical protein